VAWLPLWGWRVGAALLDLVRSGLARPGQARPGQARPGQARPGQASSTFERLFGAELYSNARLLADTDWRPRHHLDESMARQILAGAGADR
jgi:hypothetical protein